MVRYFGAVDEEHGRSGKLNHGHELGIGQSAVKAGRGCTEAPRGKQIGKKPRTPAVRNGDHRAAANAHPAEHRGTPLDFTN